MPLDQNYLAETLKTIRRQLNLTQENVAVMCGLTTRTIEKIESGRHTPNHQTLQSLARGLNVGGATFVRDAGEKLADEQCKVEEALKRNAIVRMTPTDTPKAFYDAFGMHSAMLFDGRNVDKPDAMGVAAELLDWLHDYADAWDEMSATDRWQASIEFDTFVKRLAELGFRSHMGDFEQLMAYSGSRRMVWTVLVVTLQPAATDLKVVIVPLEANCTIHRDGRHEFRMEIHG